MKTLYISDLDGTLLNNNAEITDNSKKLLNEFLSSGNYFSVATARTAATVVDMFKGTGLCTPIALMNGVCVYDTHKSKNVIKIKMDLTGTLSELNCNMDISKDDETKKLESMLKKRIKEILDEMIASLKENNSDFIGIGKYLYQNDYQVFLNK